jgi:hypothetical protein
VKRSPIAGLIVSWGLALGCRPQIGDDCVTAQDCSAQGDRLCDTSQPEGYCTVFGCDPDACPDGSVCVGFGLELDPACEVSGTDPRWKRFQRTFCLATCEEDADCREGYQCRPPAARDAASIDIESDDRAANVCLVASDAPSVEPRPCE